MRYFEADTIDQLYVQLITAVSQRPQYVVRPRGMEVKETCGVMAVLTDATKCLTTLAARKLNYAFTAIEKLEYLAGQHDQARLEFYNPNFANFRNPLGFLDGAYAPRVAYWLEHVYRTLVQDPDSRQAVLSIYGQQDRHQSKDVPCTLTHQYLLRDGKLHLVASMRSNDLLWGFPLDVNAFCFLQEVLACWLGVPVGSYTHVVGSLHLYTEREDQLLAVVEDQTANMRSNPRFDIRDIRATQHDVGLMLALEHRYRTRRDASLVPQLAPCLVPYWQELSGFIDRHPDR